MKIDISNEAHTLAQAIDLYGEQAQCDMMIEEMAELTKAICKLRRAAPGAEASAAKGHLLEEVADVYIMLAQVGMMFDPDFAVIQDKIGDKVDRLKSRIQTHIEYREGKGNV